MRLMVATALLIEVCVPLAGQDASWVDTMPGELQFEAVSIKPAAPDSGFLTFSGAKRLPVFYFRDSSAYGGAATVEALIRYGYRLVGSACREGQDIVGPAWIRSRGYDIVAKAAAPFKQPERRLLVRNMLADRFHLTMHVERRPADVYVLEVGPGGPKFAATTESGFSFKGGKIGTVDDLALDLGIWNLDCSVLNQTALPDRYKFTWDLSNSYYVRSDAASAIPMADASSTQAHGGLYVDPWTLNREIQKQLGLKLTKRKMPMPVIVVDHIESPSEN